MKLNWKEKTTGDKVITILVLVCSSLVIILSSLQLTGVWEKGNNVVGPLMCVALLLQAIREWKEQRIIAVFSLCVAIFIFVIAFIIFVGI